MTSIPTWNNDMNHGNNNHKSGKKSGHLPGIFKQYFGRPPTAALQKSQDDCQGDRDKRVFVDGRHPGRDAGCCSVPAKRGRMNMAGTMTFINHKTIIRLIGISIMVLASFLFQIDLAQSEYISIRKSRRGQKYA